MTTDEDNEAVTPVAPIANEANRQIVAVLIDHVLALQAQVQTLRQLVGKLWRDPEPYDVAHVLELELWFRRRSTEERRIAHTIHQLRKGIR